jgi:hypothetical protein
LLPIFSFLVTWARSVGIVKSEPKSVSLLPTAEFYAFLLLILTNDLPRILTRDFHKTIIISDLPLLFDELYDSIQVLILAKESTNRNKRKITGVPLCVLLIQSNSVITNSSGPAIFVRYNRVNLCGKITNLFVNNRVRHNRVSL